MNNEANKINTIQNLDATDKFDTSHNQSLERLSRRARAARFLKAAIESYDFGYAGAELAAINISDAQAWRDAGEGGLDRRSVAIRDETASAARRSDLWRLLAGDVGRPV